MYLTLKMELVDSAERFVLHNSTRRHGPRYSIFWSPNNLLLVSYILQYSTRVPTFRRNCRLHLLGELVWFRWMPTHLNQIQSSWRWKQHVPPKRRRRRLLQWWVYHWSNLCLYRYDLRNLKYVCSKQRHYFTWQLSAANYHRLAKLIIKPSRYVCVQ
jgi:hypothetical protein